VKGYQFYRFVIFFSRDFIHRKSDERRINASPIRSSSADSITHSYSASSEWRLSTHGMHGCIRGSCWSRARTLPVGHVLYVAPHIRTALRILRWLYDQNADTHSSKYHMLYNANRVDAPDITTQGTAGLTNFSYLDYDGSSHCLPTVFCNNLPPFPMHFKFIV